MVQEREGPAKRINIKNILNIIRKRGPISRVELAEILNTSKTAMSSYINYLLEEGILRIKGKGSSKEIGGKRPDLVDLNDNYKHIIGVIIGVHVIEIALADFKGKIIEKVKFNSAPEYSHTYILKEISNSITDLINKYKIDKERILGIGVGVPGIVSNKETLIFSPNLPGWVNIKLKEIFESMLGIKTIVDNESRVQAIGEKYFGLAERYDNFISVITGVGICGGIFIKNEMIIGVNSKAGEIGHITLLKDGPKCHCGNYGCWEALVSTDSLVRNINKKLEYKVSLDEIANIYNEGNNDIINKEVDEIAAWLGIGFSTILNIIDIKLIIINGEYIRFGQKFLEKVKENMKSHIFPKIKINEFQICFSKLCDEAELFGAFSMILDEIFSLSLQSINKTLIF